MAGRPWIRAYTELLTHPKFIELNNDQQASLWRLWLYAGLHETDGVITRKAAKVCSVPPRILSKLATSGWLETDHDSFIIHDWCEHQPDSETVHHKRILAANRAKAYRKRHASVTRDVTRDVTSPSRGQMEKEKESLTGSPPSPTPSNDRHAGAAPAASALAGPKPPAPEADYTPPSDEEIDAALSPELQAARRRGRVSGKAEQTRREQRAQMDAAALNGAPLTEEAARASVEFLRRKVEMEDAHGDAA